MLVGSFVLQVYDIYHNQEMSTLIFNIHLDYVMLTCYKSFDHRSLIKISGDLEDQDLQDHTWNLKFT